MPCQENNVAPASSLSTVWCAPGMQPSMHFLAKAKNVGRIKARTFARRLSHVLAINSDPPSVCYGH